MNEYYYQLIVTPKSHIGIFNDLLLELLQNAVEEKEGSLIARDSEPLEDIEWAVKQLSNKLGIETKTLLTKERNEDWISKYKNSVRPLKLEKFYIRPQWENPENGFIDIIINPALAFGSGHHESTSSCIKSISKYVKSKDEFLDVGCGSGILGVCAAKLGAKVDICDTDEIAVKSAKENFRLNDMDFVNCWVGSANDTTNRYDVVAANIIADIILMIGKDLKKRVKFGGILILSGIIDKYIDNVKDKFKEFEIIENIQNKEWHTLVLKRK